MRKIELPMLRNSCGGCTACCTVMEVGEIQKAAWTPCEHLVEKGCGIYGKHPSECKGFSCGWVNGLVGDGSDTYRPDKLGLMFTYNGTVSYGHHLICHEVWDGALDNPEAQELIEQICQYQPLLLVTKKIPKRWLATKLVGEIANLLYKTRVKSGKNVAETFTAFNI